MQELNLLHDEREALLLQMMQARAAQLVCGGIENLSDDSVDFFRRDVLLRLAEYDLFVGRSQLDLRPESPFEVLMVRWLSLDADIRDLESRGAKVNSGEIDV